MRVRVRVRGRAPRSFGSDEPSPARTHAPPSRTGAAFSRGGGPEAAGRSKVLLTDAGEARAQPSSGRQSH